MDINELDGYVFYDMVRNGLENLRLSEITINRLNVFPVPDGDTGTNMRLTLEGGVTACSQTSSVGECANKLARGMLLGARGNSGVILSQIFKGIAVSLNDRQTATAQDFAKALVSGYKMAYSAVVHPTEGTMLTVAREGIEKILEGINPSTTINGLFTAYLHQMEITLSHTTEMLDVLKEAGFVDSGGQGLVTIFRGMIKLLVGEVLTSETPVKPAEHDFDGYSFNADSELDFGYCTEFILQLQNKKCDPSLFDLTSFIAFLETLGDSIVALKEETLVKIHVHTKNPAAVIAKAQEFGEFVSFKMENMALQHNESFGREQGKEAKPHKSIAYICVAQGDGIISLFKSFGCDIVLNGGQTMNTSTEEFVDAVNSLNADSIIIMPNNKNIISAALQAREMCGRDNVFVLETKSVAECYFALSTMVADGSDCAVQLEAMQRGCQNVVTVAVARAERDCTMGGVNCKAGQYLAVSNGKIVSVDDNPVNALINGIKSDKANLEKEIMLVFKGQGLSDEAASELEDAVYSDFSDMEAGIIDGGQDVYDIIVGLS
ncbi:MAG: DAK2 domain-containing protein [Candidatus Coproplasma sp.]